MALTGDSVSRIDDWPHGIKLARWRDHDIPSNAQYNWEWDEIVRGLHLDRGGHLTTG